MNSTQTLILKAYSNNHPVIDSPLSVWGEYVKKNHSKWEQVGHREFFNQHLQMGVFVKGNGNTEHLSTYYR